MSWQMFLVRYTDEQYTVRVGEDERTGRYWIDESGRKYTSDDLPIGACWFGDAVAWCAKPSPKYHQQHAAKRPPLYVKLPGNCIWCVDAPPSNGGDGWDVTGDPPRITTVPSINFVGRYHGWIQDGVIADDCEGRKFP